MRERKWEVLKRDPLGWRVERDGGYVEIITHSSPQKVVMEMLLDPQQTVPVQPVSALEVQDQQPVQHGPSEAVALLPPGSRVGSNNE